MNTIEKKQVLIQTLAAIDNESVINELYAATILVLDNKLNTLPHHLTQPPCILACLLATYT